MIAPPTAMPATVAVVMVGGPGGGARLYFRAKREVDIMKSPAVKVGAFVALLGIRGWGGSVKQGVWEAIAVVWIDQPLWGNVSGLCGPMVFWMNDRRRKGAALTMDSRRCVC